MSVPPLVNLIDGRWEKPPETLQHGICDSSTGDLLAPQLGSSSTQVDAAVAAACRAHTDGHWRHLPGDERAAQLVAIADALQGLSERIAASDSLTTGVIVSLTTKLADVCALAFRAAAKLTAESDVTLTGNGFEVARLPLGPAAVVAPWNAPAGIACHKIASALAAGCPVLFKPSEWAPHSAQLIAQAVCDQQLPPGVFQLLHGGAATGGRLIEDSGVAAVSFTGGLAGGRAVAQACAQHIRPAQLELGGNNPLIILPDADLDQAVAGVVTALTTLNGQWCRALGRLLIHESLLEDVVALTQERLADLRLGHALDQGSQMGPLAHEHHRSTVQAALDQYRDRGATLHQPANLPHLGGWFMSPTLVTGLPPRDTQHEVFGPVATVHGFSSDDEAVALANDTPYGLAAYVFGEEDRSWALARRLQSGMVKINAVTLLNLHPDAPRPAWKLSGLGDEGTRETFEFFRTSRVLGMPRKAAS